MRPSIGFALLALSTAACSVLIPLDEFLEDGTGGSGGRGGAGPSTTTSISSAGGGGMGMGGGGADPGCTPERETDPNNCGEAGYQCEEGVCDACLCAPHSMGDFLVSGIFLDFGFGRKTDTTEIAVASLGLVPGGVVDVLSIGSDSWAITDDYNPLAKASERILAEDGRYFHTGSGIFSRPYGLMPSDGSTVVCQYGERPPEDTFDHLARGGSHIYRSAYPAGGSSVGRIDQCLTDFPGPPASFIDASTAFAWEIAATSTALLWTNRTLGGGVHRKPTSNFDVTAAETLYTMPDGVPSALGIVNGKVFFADCARRELLEIPPAGAPSKLVDSLGHVVFLERLEEPDGSVTLYAVETADAGPCAAPTPLMEDATIVRYRAGQARVLATGVRYPFAIHAHDGFIYYTQARPSMAPEVMRLPL